MPHVIVKTWPGKSEQAKQQLADRITRDVMDALGDGEASVSVVIEEVSPDDWADQVFHRDIRNPRGKLYKKPGYTL